MRIRQALPRFVLLLALVGAGVACQQAEEAATEGPEPTGEFELVGRADLVTTGATPPIVLATETPDNDDDDVPTQPGSIRLTVQSFDDELRDECGVDRDDVVSVYWLTSTTFEPTSVLANLQTSLTGRRLSVEGDIYATSAPPSPAGAATTSPGAVATTPPAASPATASCVLVAEEVEVSLGTGAGTDDGAGATASPAVTGGATTSSPIPTTSFPPGIRDDDSPEPTVSP